VSRPNRAYHSNAVPNFTLYGADLGAPDRINLDCFAGTSEARIRLFCPLDGRRQITGMALERMGAMTWSASSSLSASSRTCGN
jgi:hypothetical protein